MEFLEDLFEEFLDFWEDLAETIFHFKSKKERRARKVLLFGKVVAVRPAFVFAERIENLLKIIFGVSISVSAITAVFWGVTGLSDLLKMLINNFLGRVFMFIIGFSYFLIGLWKLSHIKKDKKLNIGVLKE